MLDLNPQETRELIVQMGDALEITQAWVDDELNDHWCSEATGGLTVNMRRSACLAKCLPTRAAIEAYHQVIEE